MGLTPDLVTLDLDLDLAGVGAARTIEKILRVHAVPIVVLSACVGPRSENGAALMRAGAVDVLARAQVRLDQPDGAPAIAFRHRLRRLARAGPGDAPRTRAEGEGLSRRSRAWRRSESAHPPEVRHALEVVLGGLPGDFPVPILVVQHMSIGFTDGLVRWLDQVVALPVALARPGPSERGVWIAPDDAHLIMEPSMRLSLDGKSVNGPHRPSGDLLLASMASVLGPRAVAVVLTGMGRDGAKGVAAIVRAGGSVIAQDEESSVVFGMPRAAVEQGAQTVKALADIAAMLRRFRSRCRCERPPRTRG